MLFNGNNPHYLSPLWANQTESLMSRAASCCLWEVTGRRGAGDGAGRRGAEVAPSGLAEALVHHSFRYLTPWRPDLGFPSIPGGKSCLYRQGSRCKRANTSAARAWRAPLTPTSRRGVPGHPSVPSLPCPSSFLSSAMATTGRLSFTVRSLLDLPEQDSQHLRRREPVLRAHGPGPCATWLESERGHYACE